MSDIRYTPVRVDVVGEIIEKIIPEYRMKASEKGLFFSSHKLAENSMIQADKSMIESVLINLINNAVQCTKSGGITIVAYNNECGRLCVDIKNTGEKLAHGIANARKLAELNNAQLIIQNSEGKGNTITVVFNE